MPGTDRTIFPETVTNSKGEEKGGVLSFIGDPLGKGLQTGLSPIGAGVGKVTGPLAEGATSVSKPLMEKLQLEDRGELAEQEKKSKETVGGKEQSGQNPLGLSQGGSS